MHWPQVVIIANMALTFALHCQNASKTRPYSPVGVLIDSAITVLVLWQGGFFAVWGWTP